MGVVTCLCLCEENQTPSAVDRREHVGVFGSFGWLGGGCVVWWQNKRCCLFGVVSRYRISGVWDGWREALLVFLIA